jgi:hypothetical protein
MTAVFLLAATLAGCGRQQSGPRPADRIEQLQREKTQIESRLEKAEQQNAELRKNIRIITGLPPQTKADSLRQLQSVRIGRFTNLYDRDKDGTKEKLIVYIKPVDRHGDIIKAAGIVEVQLWNLELPENDALLGTWRTEPEELAETWAGTIMGRNYRLALEAPAAADKTAGPLTVKVKFTDLLSGRVFDEQKVIRPK